MKQSESFQAQMLKNTVVNILHLEDKEDWQGILRDGLKTYVSFRYQLIQVTTIEDLVAQLQSQDDVTILILDLNLRSPNDDVDGLAWALKNIHAIQSHTVEVFIVSGFINEQTFQLLAYNSISGDRIYPKLPFDHKKFFHELDKIARVMVLEYANSWLELADQAVIGFKLTLLGAYPINGVFGVVAGQDYQLRLDVIALPLLTSRMHLTGKELNVYTEGNRAHQDSVVKVVNIPDQVGLSTRETFDLTFDQFSEHNTQELVVIIFYERKLLRSFRLTLHVNTPQAISKKKDHIVSSHEGILIPWHT